MCACLYVCVCPERSRKQLDRSFHKFYESLLMIEESFGVIYEVRPFSLYQYQLFGKKIKNLNHLKV